MKIHILGRNALNCALYLEFNDKFIYIIIIVINFIFLIIIICAKSKNTKKVIL